MKQIWKSLLSTKMEVMTTMMMKKVASIILWSHGFHRQIKGMEMIPVMTTFFLRIMSGRYTAMRVTTQPKWLTATIDKSVRETLHPSVLGSEMRTDWSYISLPDLMNSGIYDKSSIDKMRNMIYEQSDRRSVSTVFHRTIEGNQPDRQGYSMARIFDEKEIHSMLTTYWEKLMNWYNTIGTIASTIFGLYIMGRAMKFLIDTIVHGRILYDIYGLSWRLIASCWDSLTSLISHNYQNQKVDSLRNQEMTKLNPSAPDATKPDVPKLNNHPNFDATLDEHLKACNVVVPSYQRPKSQS